MDHLPRKQDAPPPQVSDHCRTTGTLPAHYRHTTIVDAELFYSRSMDHLPRKQDAPPPQVSDQCRTTGTLPPHYHRGRRAVLLAEHGPPAAQAGRAAAAGERPLPHYRHTTATLPSWTPSCSTRGAWTTCRASRTRRRRR
ncbi:unnamed protein product [Euphydryas editha]|uniref:Uncharacterized protein n=1 Tax=Euphydryas editha TaxID=104508 RepID=A0AAU9URV9_EUPED|nr:unnamed protein product [Euphydryas editha]